jgi:uncharacterized membrane protein
MYFQVIVLLSIRNTVYSVVVVSVVLSLSLMCVSNQPRALLPAYIILFVSFRLPLLLL